MKLRTQILVRTRLAAVDLAVVGAVHGFEQVLLALEGGVYGLERILAVLGVVARGHVEVLVADVGRDDLLVAVILLYLAQEALQTVAQLGALGQPHGQTLTYALREHEKLQILA